MNELQQLVARAIERGAIKPAPTPEQRCPLKGDRHYQNTKQRERRAKLKQQGLTARGTPFLTKRWSELDGLHGPERKQQYGHMRYGLIKERKGR